MRHGIEMDITRDGEDDLGEYELEQTQADNPSIKTDSEHAIEKSGKKRDNPNNTDDDAGETWNTTNMTP
jgi:hypothetical protein